MLDDDDLIVGTKTVVRPFWRRLFFGTLVLIIGGLIGGFGVFAYNTPTQTPYESQVSKADGIIVLTGAGYRLTAGLDLLLTQKGDRLLYTGVDRQVTKADLQTQLDNTPDGPADKAFDCCVDIETTAHDTWGNADAAKQWAQDNGYNSLIIVTSAYHMPRSNLVFRAAMPDITLISYPVATPNIPIHKWWQHPDTALLLAQEYFKTLAAWLAITTNLRT